MAEDPGTGLSPRVRGNRIGRAVRHLGKGSIPARAGEPPNLILETRIGDVYPRACGGTPFRIPELSSGIGLSPRVRGNRPLLAMATGARPSIPARAGEPAQEQINRGKRASIPARAGEPVCKHRAQHRPVVYPRACGGTREFLLCTSLQGRLSPRVRGNRRVVWT